jgi:PAS domain S-box-containing protein
MVITHVGSSLTRHAPSVAVGARFESCLRVVRPNIEPAGFEDLRQLEGTMVVLAADGLGVPLRGSMCLIADGNAILMAATPLLKSQSELAEAGFGLSDFALQDSLPDLLFAVKARDVSIKEAAESVRRQSEATKRLKSILDSSLDAMITIDQDGVVVEFNNVACEMFGLSREEAVGQDLADLVVPPGRQCAHRTGMANYWTAEDGPPSDLRIEVQAVRRTGEVFPVALAVIPFEHDGVWYFTATIRDLTEAKAAAAALAHAESQESVLQRELDHRVKNMLAQIVVLCRQAESKATADQPLLGALRSRIQSFSDAHELLSRERTLGVEMGELVRTCVLPYAEACRANVVFEGPAVMIRPRAAMTLAMVLNELATNAAKHGAIASEGTIDVRWRVEASVFSLEWHERHDGPIPDEIAGGLGAEVLRSTIPYELSGTAELTKRGNGVCFRATASVDVVLVPDD